MPVVSNSVSIAANTRVNNVLAGSKWERVPIAYGGGALIDLAVTGSAAGLEVQFSTGDRVAVERSAAGAGNRRPLIPDDVLAGDVPAYPGELLQLEATNTTGGTLTLFYTLSIDEAA